MADDAALIRPTISVGKIKKKDGLLRRFRLR
jgi:hypothetical protein